MGCFLPFDFTPQVSPSILKETTIPQGLLSLRARCEVCHHQQPMKRSGILYENIFRIQSRRGFSEAWKPRASFPSLKHCSFKLCWCLQFPVVLCIRRRLLQDDGIPMVEA